MALPERLARVVSDGGGLGEDGTVEMAREVEVRIAAAIRVALDEAAKVARECEVALPGWTTKGGRIAQEIAAAIEALKG